MSRSLITLGLVVALMGCRSEPGDSTNVSTSQEVTLVEFNTADAPTVDILVPDMMCPSGCAAKVREVLAEQPGVVDVLVNFENRTATVAVNENEFDAGAAVHLLIDDYGFPNTKLVTAGVETTDEPAIDSDIELQTS